MNRHPNTAALKSVMAREFHAAGHQLDAEAQKRREEFLLLDAVVKSHDFALLANMNGEVCASRQVYSLRVYDRLARAA